MDAPDVLWSDNHLLYYVVNTEPEQLVTNGNKCSQGKHHFSKKSLHAIVQEASCILHVTVLIWLLYEQICEKTVLKQMFIFLSMWNGMFWLTQPTSSISSLRWQEHYRSNILLAFVNHFYLWQICVCLNPEGERCWKTDVRPQSRAEDWTLNVFYHSLLETNWKKIYINFFKV